MRLSPGKPFACSEAASRRALSRYRSSRGPRRGDRRRRRPPDERTNDPLQYAVPWRSRMGRLFDTIRQLVAEEKYVVGQHASERLEERSIMDWQVVAGLRGSLAVGDGVHGDCA